MGTWVWFDPSAFRFDEKMIARPSRQPMGPAALHETALSDSGARAAPIQRRLGARRAPVPAAAETGARFLFVWRIDGEYLLICSSAMRIPVFGGHQAGEVSLSGTLSAAEIITALMSAVMSVNPNAQRSLARGAGKGSTR